jgi:high-affinity nickel-transport protein
MLVLLGLANLPPLLRWSSRPPAAVHSHPHTHDDYTHTHPHGHGSDDHGHPADRTPPAWLDRHLGGSAVYRLVRPLVIGVVHGLAGSAGVALLVLAAIPDPAWGLAYLLLFGLGTIAGMLVVTVCVAAPVAYTGRRVAAVHGYLAVASGLFSLGLGLWMMYEIGFVDGLFTGGPSPR